MEEIDIKGHAALVPGGVQHAIDKNGNTFCGTEAASGRLFGDEWKDVLHLTDISCKRCIKKLKQEGVR